MCDWRWAAKTFGFSDETSGAARHFKPNLSQNPALLHEIARNACANPRIPRMMARKLPAHLSHLRRDARSFLHTYIFMTPHDHSVFQL
jgi:hypothetical protein